MLDVREAGLDSPTVDRTTTRPQIWILAPNRGRQALGRGTETYRQRPIPTMARQSLPPRCRDPWRSKGDRPPPGRGRERGDGHDAGNRAAEQRRRHPAALRDARRDQGAPRRRDRFRAGTAGSRARNRSVIKDSGGGGKDTSRADAFVLDAGEPAVLLGTDTGPNPAELLLHALAACLTTSLVYVAAARGVRLTEVESTLEGDIDLRRGPRPVGRRPKRLRGHPRDLHRPRRRPAEKLREVIERRGALCRVRRRFAWRAGRRDHGRRLSIRAVAAPGRAATRPADRGRRTRSDRLQARTDAGGALVSLAERLAADLATRPASTTGRGAIRSRASGRSGDGVPGRAGAARAGRPGRGVGPRPARRLEPPGPRRRGRDHRRQHAPDSGDQHGSPLARGRAALRRAARGCLRPLPGARRKGRGGDGRRDQRAEPGPHPAGHDRPPDGRGLDRGRAQDLLHHVPGGHAALHGGHVRGRGRRRALWLRPDPGGCPRGEDARRLGRPRDAGLGQPVRVLRGRAAAGRCIARGVPGRPLDR